MLGVVGWHPHAPHKKEHQPQQQVMQTNVKEASLTFK
jgi:hypothetical protein